MKTIYFLILISFSIKLSAQIDSSLINIAPTTIEEYNYLTKGYKIQIESGLDMKKGYHFEDIGEHQIGTYDFKMKNLIRETANELAGVLIITYSTTSGITYYSGIPINNSKLLDQYAKDISKMGGSMLGAYCSLLSAYLSSYFYDFHKSQLRKE
jgi:hypothetical protein